MPTLSSAARAKRAANSAHDRQSVANSAHEKQRAAAELSDRPEIQPPELYAGGSHSPPPTPTTRVAAIGRAPIPPNAGGGNTGGDSAEPGFEVRGYATDPKHSGYQILTNYESTYWRAYVGVQAWALYEVLRSFCHNGNNVCYPSINYLLEVLGIKQRRVLTGWSTEVKGKQYDYPGLIEILQNGGLIIAEVVGEGHMQRYLFHVNLTPDLLRPEQVAELPALLQSKHAEMLQAHFEEMAELASRRRPAKTASAAQNAMPTRPQAHQSPTLPPTKQAAKPAHQAPPQPPAEPLPSEPPPYSLQNEDDSTINIVEPEGMTNCRRGMTNCQRGGDNLSHKQYQYNNTQLTSASTTNLINNNSGDLQQELQPNALAAENTDVVVALTELGLADSVVKRLTTRFNQSRILEKIDYLAYLQECHPNKVKNPRGWLRRAIEENYGAPDGYLNAQERAAQHNASHASPYTPPYAHYASYAPVDSRGGDVSALEGHARADMPEGAEGIQSNAQASDSRAGQADSMAERDYLRAARRERIRVQHAPDAATLAFWELVQNDVRLTMTAEHYQLIADAQLLWMDQETVAIATWDRSIYIELLHPHRAKALERTMQMLAQRKLKLVCEYWDEEGQIVPPGVYPPAR